MMIISTLQQPKLSHVDAVNATRKGISVVWLDELLMLWIDQFKQNFKIVPFVVVAVGLLNKAH